MDSTMQNSPLTVAAILRYAVNVHGDRTVTTATVTRISLHVRRALSISACSLSLLVCRDIRCIHS